VNHPPTLLSPDTFQDPIPFVLDGEISVLQVIAADPDDDDVIIFFPQVDWLDVKPQTQTELSDGTIVWSCAAHVAASPELDGRIVAVTVTDGAASTFVNWQLEVP